MLRRLTALLAAALTLVLLTVSPALAGSMYLSKTTGRAAQTWWTQIDGTPPGSSPVGNVHIGSLYVYETTSGRGDAFIYIDDWDCEPGQLPGGGHGFDEEPIGCTLVGFRFGDGYGLSFVMDRRLEQARLVGQLTLYGGHGEGGVVGRPAADITWTGVGNVIKQTSTWRYTDGTTTYFDRYSTNDRSAVMSGTIGSMGFDPDLSGGQMSSFRSMSKSRSQ